MIGEKFKREGRITSYDEYLLEFKIWELRSPHPESNQVAIRFSGRLHWVRDPLLPGMKDKTTADEVKRMYDGA